MGGREGESFASPSEQRQRIEGEAERQRWQLIHVIEELDVSGGLALEQRHGLRRAVELIEAGGAEILMGSYLDRLVRNLDVQRELVRRVEAAGGQVIAVDSGKLSNGTASQRLSGTFLGAVAEYHRHVTAERTWDAKVRAVDRGVAPFPNLPPGYRRRDDGTIEPDPTTRDAVVEAFRMRSQGATIAAVRDHLRVAGIKRSYHGVQALLASRIYLGELHFGAKLANLESHDAIVDEAIWSKVQRTSSTRGRRAKSDRLLARLGVLRCGTCGSRMVVGTVNNGQYHMYRCPPVGDCMRRVTISAEKVESVVVAAVQDLLTGIQGRASMVDETAEAERAVMTAEQALDAAVEAFSGLGDVRSAKERLVDLRTQRDHARDRCEVIRSAMPAATLLVSAEDWPSLTLDEQRALIRVVISEVTVQPGRGADRITVTPHE